MTRTFKEILAVGLRSNGSQQLAHSRGPNGPIDMGRAMEILRLKRLARFERGGREREGREPHDLDPMVEMNASAGGWMEIGRPTMNARWKGLDRAEMGLGPTRTGFGLELDSSPNQVDLGFEFQAENWRNY